MLEDALAARTHESARFLLYDASETKLRSDLHIRTFAFELTELGIDALCLKYILTI